ncbi:hypothetical protein GCM10027076_27490 [Nocardioides montaniterrae]
MSVVTADRTRSQKRTNPGPDGQGFVDAGERSGVGALAVVRALLLPSAALAAGLAHGSSYVQMTVQSRSKWVTAENGTAPRPYLGCGNCAFMARSQARSLISRRVAMAAVADGVTV